MSMLSNVLYIPKNNEKNQENTYILIDMIWEQK
jgi:hypothetical protein